jgi:hypothetical protein
MSQPYLAGQKSLQTGSHNWNLNSDSDLRSTTLEASNIDVFEESVPKRSAIGSLGQALLGDKYIIGGK